MNSLRFGESFVVLEKLINVNDPVFVFIGMMEDRSTFILGEREAQRLQGVLKFLQRQVIFLPEIGGVEGCDPPIVFGGVGDTKLLSESLERRVLGNVVLAAVEEIGAHTRHDGYATPDKGL